MMKRKVKRAGSAVFPGMPTQQKGGEEDPLMCPTCGATFFEEVTANRYIKVHSVMLGQNVPPTGQAFKFLRCLNCSQLVEPDYFATMDPLRQRYSVLLKEMELETPEHK
jgi:hypothetical protein